MIDSGIVSIGVFSKSNSIIFKAERSGKSLIRVQYKSNLYKDLQFKILEDKTSMGLLFRAKYASDSYLPIMLGTLVKPFAVKSNVKSDFTGRTSGKC